MQSDGILQSPVCLGVVGQEGLHCLAEYVVRYDPRCLLGDEEADVIYFDWESTLVFQAQEVREEWGAVLKRSVVAMKVVAVRALAEK